MVRRKYGKGQLIYRMRRSYGSSIIQRDTLSSVGCLGLGLLKVRIYYTNSFLSAKSSRHSYSPTICDLVEQWISGKRRSACWTLAYPEQRGICILCQPGMGGGISSALGSNHWMTNIKPWELYLQSQLHQIWEPSCWSMDAEGYLGCIRVWGWILVMSFWLFFEYVIDCITCTIYRGSFYLTTP